MHDPFGADEPGAHREGRVAPRVPPVGPEPMGSPLASGPALAERGVREGDLPFDPCPPRGVPAELGMLVQQVDEGLDDGPPTIGEK